MKTFSSLYLVLCSLIAALTARADNLPEVGGLSQFGQLKVFLSVKETHWFLPMSFSSSLDCGPEEGTHRTCVLKIYNSVSPEDGALLAQISRDSGRRVDYFRDLNFGITQGIDERFDGIPPELQLGIPVIMGTLALGGKFPYASLGLRMESAKAKELIRKYESSGLGTFISDVTLHGEKTEDYLVLTDTSELNAFLKRSVSKEIRAEELKKVLRDLLGRTRLVANNLTQEEKVEIAYRLIRYRYFTKANGGRLRANSARVDSLTSSLVIIDETYSPIRMRCEGKLELKAGSKQSIDCQKENL